MSSRSTFGSFTLSILTFLAIRTFAFQDVSISSTVAADKDVEVTVTNDLGAPDSFDGMFDSFRVYLATTPPGWGTGPACYLVNSTNIQSTSVKVKVPAFMGPDKTAFKISTMEFNQDPNKDGPSGFEYSNDFMLEGGNGDWSKVELGGNTLAVSADALPCSALQCARDCCSTDYPAWLEDEGKFETTYECVRKCDGVDVPSFQQLKNDNAGSESTEGGADNDKTGNGSASKGDDDSSSTKKDDSSGKENLSSQIWLPMPLVLFGTIAALTVV